ncbi:Myosin-9 like [Actinidia chinensis var. chinensis]|uniref:Myosin-9 like n=1 Tax=Actinidia chinensis var. chinensis TaxID=1590841 RepID=A0A2R6QYS6_ACTCC|nr:Myosin-9 like [Actinidia chinensis var. chinensis]
MTSAVKTTKTSSKASDTEKSDESDGVVGSVEEESDDEDISELQQAYNQLYKESYKLANSNVKLSKRLKEALEEVDSLKKVNDDTQVEISQLKNHRTTLTDKVRFLEKDAFDREGFKKALEDKVQKLETELANVHLSFKKFDAGSQKIDEIWNAQRTSFDMTGIGYKEKATTSSQLASKPYSTKAQGTSSMPNIEIMPTKFVPKCHQCGVKGHIRPHCPKLETKHVHAQFITSQVKPKHPKVIQSPKFNPICHHCGVFGHIRPYCYKLNRVSSSHAYNQPRIILTPHEFIDKPKVTIMWVRKSDLESLRAPKKFVGESLVE